MIAARREVSVPVLVAQGNRDRQVNEVDAHALADGSPNAELALIADADHVLKAVQPDDRAASFANYADTSLPITTGGTDAIRQLLLRIVDQELLLRSIKKDDGLSK